MAEFVLLALDKPTPQGRAPGVDDTYLVPRNLHIADGVQFISKEADAADAIGFDFDSENSLATAGSKLLSVKNAGAEKLYLSRNSALRVVSSNQYIELDMSSDLDGVLRFQRGLSVISANSGATIGYFSYTQSLGVNNSKFTLMQLGGALFAKDSDGVSRDLVLANGGNPGSGARWLTASKGVDAANRRDSLDLDIYLPNGVSPASGDTDGGDGGDVNVRLGGAGTPSGGGTAGEHSQFKFFDKDDQLILQLAGDRKFGLFGSSPVAQQAGAGETTGFTAGSGTGVNDDSTFTGNTGTAAYTIGDIVVALKNYGLMAAS